jgi:pyruvate oxidase
MTMAVSRGGVSHLVIPMDMWDQESTAVPREYPEHLNYKPIPYDETINKSAELINKSSKICIIFGRGAENTRIELIMLSQKINAALINSLSTVHLIKFDNPYSLGGLGLSGSEEASQLLSEVDLILAYGET